MVLFAGAAMEMILAMPISSQASYRFAPGEPLPDRSCAIGPAWLAEGEEVLLADLGDGLDSSLEIRQADPDDVHLALDYTHTASRTAVREVYRLTSGTLHCSTEVTVDAQPAAGLAYRLPLIDSDGAVDSTLALAAGEARITYRGATCIVRWNAEQISASWEEALACNRNGRYRVLRLASDAPVIELSLQML